MPPITYPAQLPVSARRADIAAAIRDNQVVIVAGETGSGKTTQIPKIALELGRGRQGQIGHTQPRRLAARTVAERINEELSGTQPMPLGSVVGYQVRFTDQSSEETLVKVMTDGILLAQIQRDPQLLAYDTIIIDEAHERSLNIDFLLGYLSRLLPQRPDLKLIITSATIDSERFAAHFSPHALATRQDTPDDITDNLAKLAPIVEVSGRTYPVEIRYRPLSPDKDADKTRREEKDLVTGIVEACNELLQEGPGDILVFLSGEREIHDTADALTGELKERTRDPKHPQHIEILPLYARLSSTEQHRVFQQHTSRRIVLATNVAETSLTVPGIHYVVDPGTARISRYSKQTKVQRLPIEPVSQASANQRSGRSGRVADGIAIRLYSSEDFAGRPQFTEPEILRTSLASVLLRMISVGVVRTPDDVTRFPFVEPPNTRAIRDGVQLLTELGALEEVSAPGRTVTQLTDVGRTLAQLPMDPRLARMVIEGARHSVAREVAIIAAALSIQDPRERPTEQRAQADQQHARFIDPRSDFLTYLNLWEYVRTQQRQLGSSAFRRLCKAEYLNFLRLREWQDVVAQLREMSKPLGIGMSFQPNRPSSTPDLSNGNALAEAAQTDGDQAESYRLAWDDDTIHRSLLAGLLSQIGMQDTGEVKASAVAHLRGEARVRALKRAKKQARNEYVGARGARFAIFPGSPLSKKPPAWIMAGELVETSRLWGRDVGRIQPEWAESLAGSLAKHTYSEPHWSTKQGAAICLEKVLLYGVPIVTDRRVLYAKVDPENAREMFVRHALVEGEWTTHHPFFHHNRALLEEASELEARSRQRGLVADEDDLFAFYDERIPNSVVSASHFDRWWSRARHKTPDLLTFTMEQLVGDATVDTAEFPEAWPQGELNLPLTYQFQPGSDADGVTVHIPVAVLARVVPDGFDWMVPGLLEDLTIATIKSLPKAVRRDLVPAPDVARDIVTWLRTECPAWEDIVRAGDMAEPFAAAFTRAIHALRGVVVPTDVWNADRVERLPGHLRVTFRVIEERGRGRAAESIVLDESTDLSLLQRKLAGRAEAAVRSAVRGAVGAALAEAEASTKAQPQQSPAQVAIAGSSGNKAGAPNDRTVAGVMGEREGLTTWPTSADSKAHPGLYDELPQSVSTDVGAGVVVRGFPALVEETTPKIAGQSRSVSVCLRILANEDAQASTHAAGVRRLLLSEAELPVKRITSRWTGKQSLLMASSPYSNTEALVADLQLAAVTSLTTSHSEARYDTPEHPESVNKTEWVDASSVRSAATYANALAFVRKHLEDEVHRIVGHVVAALSASRALEAEIRSAGSLALLNTLQDLREHHAALIHNGFISATPPQRLPHLARYLRADSHRLAKATDNPGRDSDLAWRIGDVTSAYEKTLAAHLASSPDDARSAELSTVRWMLEELRVSLFAQQLGTDGPISEKRIRRILTPTGW